MAFEVAVAFASPSGRALMAHAEAALRVSSRVLLVQIRQSLIDCFFRVHHSNSSSGDFLQDLGRPPIIMGQKQTAPLTHVPHLTEYEKKGPHPFERDPFQEL